MRLTLDLLGHHLEIDLSPAPEENQPGPAEHRETDVYATFGEADQPHSPELQLGFRPNYDEEKDHR